MKFCNQWQSHISMIWDQTPSSKMTPLTPTERGLSETSSRIMEWRGWDGLPAVLTYWTLVWSACICPVCARVTTTLVDKCWLNNGMSSHSSVWLAWRGGARLSWLCVVLPNATEAPVFWIDKFKMLNSQYVLFFLTPVINLPNNTEQESTGKKKDIVPQMHVPDKCGTI